MLFSAPTPASSGPTPGLDLTADVIKRLDAGRSRRGREVDVSGSSRGHGSAVPDGRIVDTDPRLPSPSAHLSLAPAVLNIPILARPALLPVSVARSSTPITEHEPGRGSSPSRTSPSTRSSSRATFPGAPLMPGVLMIESLSQVAAILLLQREDAPPNARVYLRGVDNAKFRRQVVPGDRLRLEVTLGRRRASLARAQAAALRRRSGRRRGRAAARRSCADDDRHPSDRHRPSAARRSAQGTAIGPHAIDRRRT